MAQPALRQIDLLDDVVESAAEALRGRDALFRGIGRQPEAAPLRGAGFGPSHSATRRSPTEHPRAWQIAVRVEKRIARARSFLSTERLTTLTPTRRLTHPHSAAEVGHAHPARRQEFIEAAVDARGAFLLVRSHQTRPSASRWRSSPCRRTRAITSSATPTADSDRSGMKNQENSKVSSEPFSTTS